MSLLYTVSERLYQGISLFSAGPLSSILVNRYGSRPVVMVGGLLVSAGMVLASFGRTIVHLYLCVGVIGGKKNLSSAIILDIMRKVAVVLCNDCFMLPGCDWLMQGDAGVF